MSAIRVKQAFKSSTKFEINQEYGRQEIEEFLRSIPRAGVQNPTAVT